MTAPRQWVFSELSKNLLAEILETRDPCTTCHSDKTTSWAIGIFRAGQSLRRRVGRWVGRSDPGTHG